MSAGSTPGRRWSGWLRQVTACGAVAFCTAGATWGIDRTMAAIAPVLLVTAMTALAMTMTRCPEDGGTSRRPSDSSRRHDVAWWCLVAAASASVVLCVAVAGALSPWLALGTAAALALTTPPSRRHLSAASAAARPNPDPPSTQAESVPDDPHRSCPTGTPGAAAPGGSSVADLDTTQLCHLWRASFWTVRDVSDPAQTVRVVQLRHDLLEELERRHPDEVRRWLTSGRHCADGPSRYL